MRDHHRRNDGIRSGTMPRRFILAGSGLQEFFLGWRSRLPPPAPPALSCDQPAGVSARLDFTSLTHTLRHPRAPSRGPPSLSVCSTCGRSSARGPRMTMEGSGERAFSWREWGAGVSPRSLMACTVRRFSAEPIHPEAVILGLYPEVLQASRFAARWPRMTTHGFKMTMERAGRGTLGERKQPASRTASPRTQTPTTDFH